MKVRMPGWHSLVAPGGLGSHGYHWWEPNANVGKPPQDLHQFPHVLLDGAWHLAHPQIIRETQAGVDDGIFWNSSWNLGEEEQHGELCGVFLFLCSMGVFLGFFFSWWGCFLHSGVVFAQQPDSLISPLWFQCLQ